jgi:hydantoinase/carbamoylase family amidase
MMKIDQDRLWKQLHHIGSFGADPRGGISRFAWTSTYRECCLELIRCMKNIDLETRMDTVGNLFGKMSGTDPSLAPIMVGSHLDTVPCGGYFDGNAGVMAALELLTVMRENNFKPHRSIEMVAFINEEASQFLGGHFGSKVMCGMLPDDYAATSIDRTTGQTMRDAMLAFDMGLDPDNFAGSRITKGQYYAMFELHIEQGRTLLDAGKPLSVLKGIAGIKQFYITLSGISAHAGGMAMKDRHDTLAAAASITTEVERLATKGGGKATRGTVGCMEIHPNEHNIIANRTTLSVDFREVNPVLWAKLYDDLMDFTVKECARRGLTYSVRNTIDSPPAICDAKLRVLLSECAAGAGVDSTPIYSYPAHDAQNFPPFCPIAMLFLRSSNNGVSHHPYEYTSPDDMTLGTQVLLDALVIASVKDILAEA